MLKIGIKIRFGGVFFPPSPNLKTTTNPPQGDE